jgi:hypothetical protein
VKPVAEQKTPVPKAAHIVARLQNLLFSENKPPQLRPVDVLLLTYLILRQTEDHYIYDSHLTLGNRLRCERRTIADSIKRLSGMRWITTDKQWQWNGKTKRKTRSIGKTVGLSVNLDKLPQAQDKTKHSRPSPVAIDLARWHTALLIKNGLGGKTRYKTFDRQQQYAAQMLIDELGIGKVSKVLEFALNDPRHQKRGFSSLYWVRAKLPAIKRDYDAAQSAAASSPVPSITG